jgi:hypothetical protein
MSADLQNAFCCQGHQKFVLKFWTTRRKHCANNLPNSANLMIAGKRAFGTVALR